MRGMDCKHDLHDDVHFSAVDDEALFSEVKQHTQVHHPEITDDQIRDMISSSAYAE